ncbi:MAG TPA: hypothetical protein PK661_00680 [Syntrophorhabdaceae bacterium]|nr:hypothetical protein [Pseudomonadota bacterium]HOS58585.1 hypothetical protein [Syntrophorhabdaceae bacterium]
MKILTMDALAGIMAVAWNTTLCSDWPEQCKALHKPKLEQATYSKSFEPYRA